MSEGLLIVQEMTTADATRCLMLADRKLSVTKKRADADHRGKKGPIYNETMGMLAELAAARAFGTAAPNLDYPERPIDGGVDITIAQRFTCNVRYRDRWGWDLTFRKNEKLKADCAVIVVPAGRPDETRVGNTTLCLRLQIARWISRKRFGEAAGDILLPDGQLFWGVRWKRLSKMDELAKQVERLTDSRWDEITGGAHAQR